MRLIRGFSNLKSGEIGHILTIGNYDGIHLGHQKILRSMVACAKVLNQKTMVITFLPRPREYFGKCCAANRLMSLREQVAKFKQIGIDYVLILKFNQHIAMLSAEDFILNILVNNMNIKEIFIGEDFCFGCNRLGNVAFLNECAKKYHFNVHVVKSLENSGVRISSTELRNCIETGNLAKIRSLLGHNFSIVGRIVRGDGRGTLLGFPTANINMARRIMFDPGVYIVRIWGLHDKTYQGVANLGFRPTIGDKKYLLEFHLFDFNENIYGKIAEVEFLYKIRAEKKFDSLELLIQQIKEDIAKAKQYFRIMQ